MGRSAVLVAGAINTDLVARVLRAPEAGETVTGTRFDVFGGGKGANQALSCARSGAATFMLGAVGNDEFGAQRLADLRADGVDTRGVVTTSEAASGVALITVEESGQNRIAYVPGATATISGAAAVAAFDLAQPAIVMTTLELPANALRQLFSRAKAAGATVIVNATPEPSAGRDLVAMADIVIANESEALELLNEESAADWSVVCDRLRSLGPNWAIVTIGSEGALSHRAGVALHVRPPKVHVVDTTGAGDSFCGAFAARLAEGANPDDAVRAGVAAGSLAVTIDGAQRSMPRRSQVDEMMARLW